MNKLQVVAVVQVNVESKEKFQRLKSNSENENKEAQMMMPN